MPNKDEADILSMIRAIAEQQHCLASIVGSLELGYNDGKFFMEVPADERGSLICYSGRIR